MEASVVEAAEALARLTVGGLLALILIAILRGWLVTKIRHDDVVRHYERLLEAKEAERSSLAQDRDWWKDATVTALQIGEVVAGRSSPTQR
jgi:hypothetical protein